MTGARKDGPEFVPGLELAEGFFREAVSPLLAAHAPGLKYSAALIGTGSEVLGFDDVMSTDHCWGPKVMLFLRPSDLRERGAEIDTVLTQKLPRTYRDYPTFFGGPGAEDGEPVSHRVELLSLSGFFESYLGIAIEEELEPADWLTLPHQKLRSISAGRVFRDDLGLGDIRARLEWYPHDVWLYVLASCWTRIGQEEHLMGRAGFAGDEVGSATIGGRLVRDLMRLAFLMEREYPPYAKWFGTAFSKLDAPPALAPALTDALHATSWRAREAALCTAYRIVGEAHNGLGLTDPVSPEPSAFWSRPFRVIHAELFEQALAAVIEDPQVRALSERRLIGNVDLLSDNTDLLEDSARCRALRELYR